MGSRAPVKEEVFGEAIQLRPGNRRVVHHSIANIVDLADVKRITPGSYIEFNMHDTPSGKEETDRAVLGLWFAKGPIHHEVISLPARQETYVGGKKVGFNQVPNIPPGVDNWEIVGRMNVRDDITVYAFSPHMHFRGKGMKYTLTDPNGREEVLLNVPRYNYEWQLNSPEDRRREHHYRGGALRQLEE